MPLPSQLRAACIKGMSKKLRTAPSSVRMIRGSALRSMSAAAVSGDDRGMDQLAFVYTAAFAASGNRAVADQVSERVMVAAPAGDAAGLAERAVLLALRASPGQAFAPMQHEEREVVALARLTGATTGRMATLLGISQEEVRARLTRGLRALLSAGGAPRTPPPRPDSECAVSRGRA